MENVLDADALITAIINDGEHSLFQQETPKARILAALNHIKERQTK